MTPRTNTPTTAQATSPTDRRLRPRRATPACTANHCHQGRAACPCPQACELPAPDADPLQEAPATAMELAGLAFGITALVLTVCFIVKACASA